MMRALFDGFDPSAQTRSTMPIWAACLADRRLRTQPFQFIAHWLDTLSRRSSRVPKRETTMTTAR